MESLPTTSLICKNLQSAISKPYAVNNLIFKKSGFTTTPFDSPPFEWFPISCIGMATVIKQSKYFVDPGTTFLSENVVPIPTLNLTLPINYPLNQREMTGEQH